MVETEYKVGIINSRNKFSILSVFLSIITLGLCIYILVLIPEALKPHGTEKVELTMRKLKITTNLVVLFWLSGSVFTLLSFLREETSFWLNRTACILNILLCLIIFMGLMNV